VSAAGLVASEADRAALAEVLAAPEFQAGRWRGDALRQWLAGWWERLTALLGTSEAERWAGLGRAVFLATVVVAGLLLWRAARRRGRARSAAPRPRSGPAAPGRPAGVPIAEAERALAAGDGPAAVRLAFLAAVRVVGGRLAAPDGLTGRELAGRVADAGFSRLAWLHERTVFGRRPVTSEEAAEALAAAARLASDRAPGPAQAGGGVTR
jgi:hypothetical protein